VNFTHAILDSPIRPLHSYIIHAVRRNISNNDISLHAPFIPNLTTICMSPEVHVYLCITCRDPKRLLFSEFDNWMNYLQGEVCREPREHVLTLEINPIRSGTQLDILVQNSFKIPGNPIYFGSSCCRPKSGHGLSLIVRVSLGREVDVRMGERPQLLDLICWFDGRDVIVCL